MLVGLGAHVLWRLWRDRVHFHNHSHGDGAVHIHAHSHAGETAAHARSVPHARATHDHAHGFRWRTLLVGLMHGMAGSAALLVLTVSQASSPAVGLGLCRAVRHRLDDRHGRAVDGDRGAARGVRALADLGQSARLQAAVGAITIAIGVMTIVTVTSA